MPDFRPAGEVARRLVVPEQLVVDAVRRGEAEGRFVGRSLYVDTVTLDAQRLRQRAMEGDR